MLPKILNIFKKIHFFGIAAVLITASCGLSYVPAFAKSSTCDDVKLIFARGSGEPLDGPSMSAWRDEIVAAINETSKTFSYSFYELGSRAQSGHQYPAVTVSDNFDGYVNLVGAYFSGGAAFRFGKSVEEGIKELLSYVKSISAACPRTKFVLGGYSQGAMVLSASLPALNADRIIYVSTFGDPKLYLPEGKSTILGTIPKVPDACRGVNLSTYRVSVPDCRAYEGVLGSYRPYQPEDYAGKLGTWCNEKDIMCSSGLSISDHTSYVSSNLYRDAATVISQKLSLAFPKYDWTKTLRIAKHNVAFVIDTTISMGNTIHKYRAEAKTLAARVKADGGDVALIEYRDLQEDFTPRKLCDFSCNLTTFTNQLDSLEVHGGGDLPESALSAIHYALDNLNWQIGATKTVVLLTDAAYHDPDYDGTTFLDVVQRSLEIDPVNVFAIIAKNRGIDHTYDELAAATSGQVFLLGDVDLSETSTIIFDRPVARLALSAYSGQIGDELYFDASASYSSDGSDLRFDWDLNGDGEFELADVEPIIRHTYDHETDHFIQVRVTDRSGKTSTMSAEVSITNQSTTPATITNLEVSPQDDNAVLVSFQSDGAKALLSTEDLVRGFLEIRDGAGQFVLQDVPGEMSITLTPYSSSDERGISESAIVPATKSPNVELPAPETSSAPGVQSTPSNSSTLENAPIKPDLSNQTPTIPKAPNTGLISRKRH